MTWGLVERILKHAALTRRRARSPTQGLADDGGAGSSCVGVDHGGGVHWSQFAWKPMHAKVEVQHSFCSGSSPGSSIPHPKN